MAAPSGPPAPPFSFWAGAATNPMTAVKASGDTSGLISAPYTQGKHLIANLNYWHSEGYNNHQIRGFRAFLSCSNAHKLMRQ